MRRGGQATEESLECCGVSAVELPSSAAHSRVTRVTTGEEFAFDLGASYPVQDHLGKVFTSPRWLGPDSISQADWLSKTDVSWGH